MDYISISIAVASFVLGAILVFFLAPKSKEITDNKLKQSEDKGLSSQENGSENLKGLQEELNRLKGLLAKSEAKAKESERSSKNLAGDKNTNFDNNETNSLDKQIAKLEEEIEELEDEISDLEKRNKNVKEEVSILDDKLYTLEKERNKISETNQQNLQKLEILEIENKNQKESLGFISDILNANNIEDDKILEVDNKTYELISFIWNDLRYSLKDVGNEFITDDFLEDCLNWRNQEIKTWIKDKRVVAIVGEFSAGKTSIVNRILKQDDPNAIELPVNSKETTAIPTYISNGIDFNCQYYSPSGDLKNISAESFQKVTKSVIDNINISSLVKYFVLSYSNKNLENISILDTPGFASNSDEIISKTTEVVREADALFWVIDANTGAINNSSINVIKDNLQKVPLYIIINWADTKSKEQLSVLKQKIEETLDKNKIDFKRTILFSREYEIDELMGIINSIPRKKSPKIISILKEEIKKTLEQAKNQLNELNKEERNLNNRIEESKNILENLIQDIDYSLVDMDSVISFESSFFGKDYFKIKEIDYGKFENGMNQIADSRSNLPDHINEFISNIENHNNKLEERNNLKYYIKNLSDSEKRFLKLIKEYNPELLN